MRLHTVPCGFEKSFCGDNCGRQTSRRKRTGVLCGAPNPLCPTGSHGYSACEATFVVPGLSYFGSPACEALAAWNNHWWDVFSSPFLILPFHNCRPFLVPHSNPLPHNYRRFHAASNPQSPPQAGHFLQDCLSWVDERLQVSGTVE